MQLLDRACSEVMYGGRDPKEVLDELTKKAQDRLTDVAGRLDGAQ